MILLIDICYIL